MKVLFVLVCAACVYADAAKILGVFPLPSKSHHLLGSALLKELAIRGHEVTMISSFPLENPPKNYNDIRLEYDEQQKEKHMKMMMENKVTMSDRYNMLKKGVNLLSRSTLESKNVQAFLNTKPQFDLVIHMWGLNEALLGIGHTINATTIGFAVMGGSPFLTYLTHNPTPYSYVPHVFLPYTDNMSFLQRVLNTLIYVSGDIVLNLVNLPYQQYLLDEFFPNAPPLKDLISDVDITLTNSHIATESARPYLPNVIQIGGYHLHEKQDISEELSKFLNESKNGVIVFSMGSNVKSADLPKNTLQVILDTFRSLEYDFVWKFESDLSDIPKNVKISKWLPQRAVLGHPNVKAFISHGGLGGTVEAIYHGVPMVCMPIVMDQAKNAADSVKAGYAIQVDVKNLTQTIFTKAIRDIINDPKYKRNALLKSDVYKNQPMNPMDKAVYWVEHVIRHKGAKHMKSRVTEIPWYQYLLLDVTAFILLCSALITFIFAILCKISVKIIRRLFKKKSDEQKEIKKKTN